MSDKKKRTSRQHRRMDEKYAISQEVKESYAGQVVAVYGQKVWGAGNTVSEALEAAQAAIEKANKEKEQNVPNAVADFVLAGVPQKEEEVWVPFIRTPGGPKGHPTR